MSALLTTTMRQMKFNLDAFREKGLLQRVRVMIGGPTVTKEWAASIGADYAKKPVGTGPVSRQTVAYGRF